MPCVSQISHLSHCQLFKRWIPNSRLCQRRNVYVSPHNPPQISTLAATWSKCRLSTTVYPQHYSQWLSSTSRLSVISDVQTVSHHWTALIMDN